MTDKEKLIALFTEFGIGFSNHTDRISIECPYDKQVSDLFKVEGYPDYSAQFTFDENGKFINVDIWGD